MNMNVKAKCDSFKKCLLLLCSTCVPLEEGKGWEGDKSGNCASPWEAFLKDLWKQNLKFVYQMWAKAEFDYLYYYLYIYFFHKRP